MPPFLELTSLVHVLQFCVLFSLLVLTDQHPVTASKVKVYHAYVRKDVCVRAYIFVSMHMCVCECVCVLAYVRVCMYTYRNVHVCVCMSVHTYTYL